MRRSQRTLLAAAVLAMAATACGPGGGSSHGQGPPPLAVDVATAQRQDIATFVTLDGQIAPVQESTLSSPQSGNVAAVYVNEGQHVARRSARREARRLDAARFARSAGRDRSAAVGATRLGRPSRLRSPPRKRRTPSSPRSSSSRRHAVRSRRRKPPIRARKRPTTRTSSSSRKATSRRRSSNSHARSTCRRSRP